MIIKFVLINNVLIYTFFDMVYIEKNEFVPISSSNNALVV